MQPAVVEDADPEQTVEHSDCSWVDVEQSALLVIASLAAVAAPT